MTHGSSVSRNEVFSSDDDSIPTKPDLEDFWNIEAIGIKDNPKQRDDQRAMAMFKETLIFKDNRYSVMWPWKNENTELPTNRQLALGRLKSLTHKLSDKPDLMKQYNSVIQDQLENGIVEKVEANKVDGLRHYLPHHAVIKPDRATTKLRIVYDASAKTKETNNILNECLHRRPVLLHDLCGTLIRLRLHEVGMVADTEKAFLQISLQTSQRDVTRFLWLKDIENMSVDSSNIQEYRFCRVPFGVISSPFLLGATIDYHIDSYNSDIAKKLKDDIYMDNLITGASSVNDAIELYTEAKHIFAEANMNIREWLSNDESVNSAIPSNDHTDDEITKVLGLRWNTKTDNIGIKPVKFQNDQYVFTKRSVLKDIASVFDPLGMFSPVILRGKLLIQTLWTKEVPWDQKVSDEDSLHWKVIQEDLLTISNHEIPRHVCVIGQNRDKTNKLVCFCDASKKAYAAVVYLLQGNEGTLLCMQHITCI